MAPPIKSNSLISKPPRTTCPTKETMLSDTVGLFRRGGDVPTIDQVRSKLGGSMADSWVNREFGGYSQLISAARRQFERGLAQTTHIPAPARSSDKPLASSADFEGRPSFQFVSHGLAHLRTLGITETDPVRVVFLRNFWRSHHGDQDILPRWGDWKSYVMARGAGLVSDLEKLQVLGGKPESEWQTYATVTARQKRLYGEWRLYDFGLEQADTLEGLPAQNDVAGAQIWLRRRGRTHHYDWVGAKGNALQGVIAWGPDKVENPVLSDANRDHEKLEKDRRHLQKLLAAFEALAQTQMPPLFTPAEPMRERPLIHVAAPLKTDARGFAPSVLEWKDLANRPSEKRFAGRLSEPSKFEILMIWAASLASGAWLFRNLSITPLGSTTNSGSLFFNSSNEYHPEGT